MIQDSGNRREFETGAVRDMAEGKGRCDLMPLDVIAEIYRNNDPERGKDDDGDNDYTFTSIERKDLIPGTLTLFELFKAYGSREYLMDAVEYIIVGIFESRGHAFLELAKHFEDGCKKYGENNWKKGIPVKFYIDSAVRHLLKFYDGWTDEDHGRAALWNVICAIWTCKHMPELNEYKKEETK